MRPGSASVFTEPSSGPSLLMRKATSCAPPAGKSQTRSGITRVFDGHLRPFFQRTPEQTERLLSARGNQYAALRIGVDTEF